MLNYQHNVLLPPNCLSIDNSYVPQGGSILNNCQTFRSAHLRGLFSSADIQTMCYRIMARPCSFPTKLQPMIVLIRSTSQESGPPRSPPPGLQGKRDFICNRTIPAHHSTWRALGMLLRGAELAAGLQLHREALLITKQNEKSHQTPWLYDGTDGTTLKGTEYFSPFFG